MPSSLWAAPRPLQWALPGVAHSRGAALNCMNQRSNSYGLERAHTQPCLPGWRAHPGPGNGAGPTSHLTYDHLLQLLSKAAAPRPAFSPLGGGLLCTLELSGTKQAL